MLNHLNLDDRTYREIESDAIYHIPREYPEWTNYNPSDPGVTLVQMFSWLKEVQQYHLSQVSDQKRLKYLKLLGMKVRHVQPARGAVSVDFPEEEVEHKLPLQRGSRFFSENMAFETVEKQWICPTKLIGSYMKQRECVSKYQNIGNDFEKQIKLYPFGLEPEVGNQCCFLLDRALSKEWKTNIYFAIRTDYKVTRNPVQGGFIPLAKLKWEYRSVDGWEELQLDTDDTHEFLQSGRISFRIQREMALDEETGAYQIRVTLEENYYDVAPLIENIYLNEIEVKQQYTLCDYEECEIILSQKEEENIILESDLYLAGSGQMELYVNQQGKWRKISEFQREVLQNGNVKLTFSKPYGMKGKLKCRIVVWEDEIDTRRIVGVGDAFAHQEYHLNISDIVYEEFEIWVHDEQNETFIPYYKVEDFDNCTPEDAVYILDITNRKVIFGDCEKGMAPNGKIYIVRLRTSLGRIGNIKANKIRECEAYPNLLVRQYKKTMGGKDQETIDQCFERFRREMKSIRRGVTYSDYEELVKKTPGLLVVDSRVISPTEWKRERDDVPENQIAIVVQPLSYKKRDGLLNERYRQNLEKMLSQKKMLGTRIRLLNPEYIGISVYAEVGIKGQFQDAEVQIEKAVRDYLNENTWEIGKPVLGSNIYGIIDTLPCVWQVQSLVLDAKGKGCRRLVNGDVGLPPNGVVYLRNLNFSIYTAD